MPEALCARRFRDRLLAPRQQLSIRPVSGPGLFLQRLFRAPRRAVQRRSVQFDAGRFRVRREDGRERERVIWRIAARRMGSARRVGRERSSACHAGSTGHGIRRVGQRRPSLSPAAIKRSQPYPAGESPVEHRAALIEGMRGSVKYGTASKAGLGSLQGYVFGKTGTSTSSVRWRTQGWFVGFAADKSPVGAPRAERVVLGVLVFLKRAHGSQ